MSDKCGYCDSGDITCPFCKTNYSIHKWISVEDRLPDAAVYASNSEFCFVLGFTDVGVREVMFMAGNWYLDGEWIIRVTHWMPLPLPPQEGE